ncbi:hypothetical protein AB0I10_30335 [Streptomyces sp. NPDC050636]|uniref:hypothetical protein n=1 Tax=Streptomyces sp. NPDC050636 TaxID=3154510 RepID=UPI0034414F21
MDTRRRGVTDGGDIADVAERLRSEPLPRDFDRPPDPLRDYKASMTPAQRTNAIREVLNALVDRIGPPTLYGGSAYGPTIRWRTDERILLLDHGVACLQVSVRRTEELERSESDRFAHGVGDGEEQVSFFSSLPYLWQLYRDGPGTLAPTFPTATMAPDWHRLEESVESILWAWSEQLPAQVGNEESAAFNIVNHKDGDRPLSVGYSPEGMFLVVDDRDAPEGGSHRATMESRGWQVAVHGWWEATFPEPGWESAAAAARIAIAEVRSRGALTPGDLGAADISCADRGLLLLPGLGISH